MKTSSFSAIRKSPWLEKFSHHSQVDMRLFCFPYAGGNAHIFRDWASNLPSSIEIIGIQAPGKGSRLLEKPCETLKILTEELIEVITPLLNDIPFSFFGHSNGALVAFEMSCLLQSKGLPTPRHLFLSASPAPWTRVINKPYSEMSKEEFKNLLRDLDGTPPEILEHPEIFDLVLPGLQADFSLSENYTFTHPKKLSVPTHIFYGEKDKIEKSQILAWQDQIENTISYDRMMGGHFFIHGQAKQLTDIICRRISHYKSKQQTLSMA